MKERIKFFKVIIIVVFVILAARSFQLQIIQGEQYFRMAENNRISIRPVSAPRGRIYSSDGNTLVSSQLSYNLYFQPNELSPGQSRDDVFIQLSEVIDHDREELEGYFQRGKERSSPGEGILLKRNISQENMILIEESRDVLSGIVVREAALRDYVHNSSAAHLLGYVGEINLSDLRSFSASGLDYSGGDIIGITGLEREYEKHLKGEKGYQAIEVNQLGHKTELLEEKKPSPGHDLYTTIDWELQIYLEDLLEESFSELTERAEEDDELRTPLGASAMIMEVDTGKILGMASYPTFNPNNFAKGFNSGEYNSLIQDPLQPLINRNIMATSPPGSIFKLITGTAAIENLSVTRDSVFNDRNGRFYIPGWSRPFHNWMNYGEGELTFVEAMARSNNIIFYELGYELYEEYGGSKLVETAREFGLGRNTGVDLPGEKSGRVPDGNWKRTTKGEGWYPGDSVNMAIGQGDILTTPIQLLQVTAAIANKGKYYRPYLVDRIVGNNNEVVEEREPELAGQLSYSESTFNAVEAGLLAVTMSNRGTARGSFSHFPIDIAGKTGTAQIGGSGSSHGWFVAYGPVPDPELAVVVFLERGETSGNAAPIAADIFAHYYNLFPEEESEVDEEDS
ncbi:MAG: penicillin-binding protein 2 [Bacillota bacterium]